MEWSDKGGQDHPWKIIGKNNMFDLKFEWLYKLLATSYVCLCDDDEVLKRVYKIPNSIFLLIESSKK